MYMTFCFPLYQLFLESHRETAYVLVLGTMIVNLSTVKLSYKIMNRTEYFVSLKTNVCHNQLVQCYG